MPSDTLSQIGIAFAAITFCLAGASTIPSIYVTLASAARRVKINKRSATATSNASLATSNVTSSAPTATTATAATSEGVNDWTEEVMIKRDGATIHIFVKQAARVIHVAMIIISIFYLVGYLILLTTIFRSKDSNGW
jgi:hypothetical protein